MKKVSAVIYKEFITLVRDIPGLSILFIMPLLLVIVVTLVQDKVLNDDHKSEFEILFVDNDHDVLSQAIEEGLRKTPYFHVIKEVTSEILTEESAETLIGKGEFQLGVVIPRNAGLNAKGLAGNVVRNAITQGSDSQMTKKPMIRVLLDPTVRNAYKSAALNILQRLVQSVETKMVFSEFLGSMPEKLSQELGKPLVNELNSEVTKELKRKLGSFAPADLKTEIKEEVVTQSLLHKMDSMFAAVHIKWEEELLVSFEEMYAGQGEAVIEPTVVQNNVPAFSLFAMFFIVIPLSGSILGEKNEGTYTRMRTIPVNYTTLLAGKIIVYLVVCLIQFCLMLLLGFFVLPGVFGMPILVTGNHYFAILLAAIASALSAIGFGLIIGTYANTHAQASMFGAMMVMIFGVLGGIFLPIYMMPDLIKSISILSPIRWGIDSFLDIFVRSADIRQIIPDLLRMTGFFCIAFLLSLLSFTRRN